MITKLSKEDVLELIAQSSLEELLKINREISIEIARIKLILIQTYIYGHSAEFYTKALAAAQGVPRDAKRFPDVAQEKNSVDGLGLGVHVLSN